MCVGLAEDAVDQALVALLESARDPRAAVVRAWRQDGCDGVRRMLGKVAWRSLRGELRLMCHQMAHASEVLPDQVCGADPSALLIACATARHIEGLIPVAARRYARRDAALLACALADRLETGEDDSMVAGRHGVERSQVCRARQWLASAVMGGSLAA